MPESSRRPSSSLLQSLPALFRGSQTFATSHTPIVVNRHVLSGSHLPHDHDFLEIVLIGGGRGKHCSLNGEQAIGAGDVFLLRNGAWHAYRDCRDLEVANCCFGSELLRRELAFLFEDPALNYLLWSGPMSLERRGLVALKLRDDALQRFHDLLQALENADAEVFSHGERVAYLVLLLSHLTRYLGSEHRAALERSRRAHPAVSSAIRVLEEQPQRAWTLGELARQVHLDKSYLSRLFKAHSGLAPLEYLSRLRLERAASLLLRSDLPVGEVALRSGWNDANYFARRFKAHFAMSAQQYRRQFAQNEPAAKKKRAEWPHGSALDNS